MQQRTLYQHRDAAQKQRSAFLEMLILWRSRPDFCVIIIDFKESFRTGGVQSACSTGEEYHTGSHVSDLGMAVFLPGREKPLFIDFLSRNVCHDSAVAAFCLKSSFQLLWERESTRDSFCKVRRVQNLQLQR